jgi:DNA polymerase III gamma/tau subunit
MPESESMPYTADQRDQIKKINETATLNTLSRIWQVMTASAPEMQSAGNQKQCFDMLVVRLMHIADMPPVASLMQQSVECKVKSVDKVEHRAQSTVHKADGRGQQAEIPAPEVDSAVANAMSLFEGAKLV